MKFKVDENLPLEFAQILISQGFTAETVFDELLGGASDATIFHKCCQESRILLTLDTDFANILAYSPGGTAGIVVFRLNRHDKISLISALERIIPAFTDNKIQDCLWIVEHDRIRIRELAVGRSSADVIL